MLPASWTPTDVDAFGRPVPDRRVLAAALLCAAFSGAAFGIVGLSSPLPNGTAELAFVLGGTASGFVALFSLSWSKSSHAWLFALIALAVLSGRVPSAIADGACDRGNMNACIVAGRRSEAIVVERRGCERNDAAACQRLITLDPMNTAAHCEVWAKACQGGGCANADQRCVDVAREQADAARGQAANLQTLAEGGSLNAMNSLAWTYATSTDAVLRDGPMAVSWAEKAVAGQPSNPAYLDTLAAAYAEVGRWDEAERTQLRAVAALHLQAKREMYLAHLATIRAHQPIRE